MSGHVSMMTDVLIAQLPPALLRSSLRFIVSQDHAAQQFLTSHVRSSLTENPLAKPPKGVLFPSDGNVTALQAYMSLIRCLFSCHMIRESLPHLIHLIQSITVVSASWSPGSILETTLVTSSADIVQAVQAMKEAKFRPQELQSLVVDLLHSLQECNQYCQVAGLSQPYIRAQSQVADALSLLFPSSPTSGPGPIEATPNLFINLPNDIAPIETTILGSKLVIPRLFNGFWQMSSPAWGSASATKMDEALIDLVRHGLVASDMADHYGDAELVYGSFKKRLPQDIADRIITATKWCVFAPLKGAPAHDIVLAAVKERSARVGGPIDLLQFHWQDYENDDYLIVIKLLVEITKLHPELVLNIGLCNFDSLRTEKVCEYMLRETGSVGIVSNQVQYSMIDSRPVFAMATVCERYGIKLLTYGSFCGGFLSDRWLDEPAPVIYDEAGSLTPSQRKYLDMIYTWGSWQEFQKLLAVLRKLADIHAVDISNVATRWVLQRPEVAAVIVGTRLGVSSNLEANLKTFKFKLSPEAIEAIEEIALGKERVKALALYKTIGDCGQEYR